MVGWHLLPCVDTVTILGVWHEDKTLTYSNHCNIICDKANARANLILHIGSFRSRCVEVLVKVFVTFVRPLVEYASPVWSPRLAWVRAMAERVEKRFTKRLAGFHHYTPRVKKTRHQTFVYIFIKYWPI